MSVLLEALSRANARKESLWGEGRTAKLDDHRLLLMLSGADLDPTDLAAYMDVTAFAFTIQWASGEPTEAVILGLLAEGLLMGMMIEQVQRKDPAPEPEPTIFGTARTLASLCLLRAQRVKDALA